MFVVPSPLFTKPPTSIRVGVYIVMVCQWTDHILARNPLLEVEADLPDGGDFPTCFSLIYWRATNSK